MAASSFATRSNHQSVVPYVLSEMRTEIRHLATPNATARSAYTPSSQQGLEAAFGDRGAAKSKKKKKRKKKKTNMNMNMKESMITTSESVRSDSDDAVEELEVNRKRKLWRAFRRRMHKESKAAIAYELQMRNDSLIQHIEQEDEVRDRVMRQISSFVVVDCELESDMPTFEMVLPPSFKAFRDDENRQSDTHTTKEKTNVWTIDKRMWDLLNIFGGRSWTSNSAERLKDDASCHQTVETVEDTYSLSSSRSMDSCLSWRSWNSVVTEKVCNAANHSKPFELENDDPWAAAKRGDLETLENRWKNRHDWTLENEEGDTPLYLACRYGGARNPRVVLFLLQQWPQYIHIPESLLRKCIHDSANIHVEEILIHPSHAEMIILDFEDYVLKKGNGDDSAKNTLDDILEEEDEDEIEFQTYQTVETKRES